MSLRDIALAFLVVAVWGTNFVVIKAGLRDMPPFLFALLRFLFSAVPFVFFLPRPRTPWRWIALYGVLVGAGQFGLLYYAMRADISPGLASLVIQSQAIFTIALSVWIFHERVGRLALAGVAIAVAGLAVIASHLDGSATLAGIVIVLAAGLAWAVANVVGKKASAEREAPFGMLAFIAWASVFAVPPLVLLTVVLEGPAVAWHAMANADAAAWGAVAW
jgi:O-acetylserine/cysteine efflux transporter